MNMALPSLMNGRCPPPESKESLLALLGAGAAGNGSRSIPIGLAAHEQGLALLNQPGVALCQLSVVRQSLQSMTWDEFPIIMSPAPSALLPCTCYLCNLKLARPAPSTPELPGHIL